MEEIYKLFGSRPRTMPLSDLWNLLIRFAEQRNIFFSVGAISIGMRFNSVVLSLAKISLFGTSPYLYILIICFYLFF